jgi:hypothetical protein
MSTSLVPELLSFIGGTYVQGARSFDVVNPADGTVVATVHEASREQVDSAVGAARRALDGYCCFAHGGGSFPLWLGRFENAWHKRPDRIVTSQKPSSAYLDRFSVDSVVLDPVALRLLVDTLGADR